ncbi:unnamed protein product [Paramecium pentaurelia]|uniref:Uncharacterized protein n=1 Tax=Paramecium pentaurelia TaxID=43138 RepID=A0A8S1VYE7_9CILI|nr:unnamed protein product [Paramecium pentaurelia]
MEKWNLIRQECKDQSESDIAYLFQRFPSLQNLLKIKILDTLPNSYLVCYALEKCTLLGDIAVVLNLKTIQGIIIQLENIYQLDCGRSRQEIVP